MKLAALILAALTLAACDMGDPNLRGADLGVPQDAAIATV